MAKAVNCHSDDGLNDVCWDPVIYYHPERGTVEHSQPVFAADALAGLDQIA
jgi:hypothetical protein